MFYPKQIFAPRWLAFTAGLLLVSAGAARADRLISDFNGTGFDVASPMQTVGPTFDTLATTALAASSISGEFDYATPLNLTGLTGFSLTYNLTLQPSATAYLSFQLRDTSGDRSSQTFVLSQASTGGFVTQTFGASFDGAFGGTAVDPTNISRITFSVSNDFFNNSQPNPNAVAVQVDNVTAIGIAAAPEPSTWVMAIVGLAGLLGIRAARGGLGRRSD